MTITEYTNLLNKPIEISSLECSNLEKIINEFPYFQSARALYLKGLYNQNSFKYNYVLKNTAAYTIDRSVLFDFITSESFSTLNIETETSLEYKIEPIILENNISISSDKVEKSILASISAAKNNIENSNDELFEKIDSAKENLALGKPLAFLSNEKHSFQEWLQIAKSKPIERKTDLEINVNSEKEIEKQKKIELIDKFIESNPKIPQAKPNSTASILNIETSKEDNSYIMTETLARVYLEQHKFQKAIQAYEILILKYPEKSSFFADRILDIKILKQNNNTKQ